METMKKLFEWLKSQSIVVRILAIIASVCIAVAVLFFSSCGVAKTAISGDKVIDKNVRDSTHYEVVLEK